MAYEILPGRSPENAKIALDKAVENGFAPEDVLTFRGGYRIPIQPDAEDAPEQEKNDSEAIGTGYDAQKEGDPNGGVEGASVPESTHDTGEDREVARGDFKVTGNVTVNKGVPSEEWSHDMLDAYAAAQEPPVEFKSNTNKADKVAALQAAAEDSKE